MMIWLFQTIFGLLVAHRTLILIEGLHLVGKKNSQRINWAVLGGASVVFLSLHEHISWIFFLTMLIFFGPWMMAMLVQKNREKMVRTAMVPVLDHVVLSMRSGKGFRTALFLYSETAPRHLSMILKDFLSSLQYQKHLKVSSDRRIQFFFYELAQIDQCLHKPIDRLKALRHRLMIEDSFRRKSRQAVLQVKMQSGIITGLYLLLLVYVHYEFGLSQQRSLVFCSSGLFLLGFIWVHRIGKRYQWKL
ncbi:MAG: hypothetical protein COT73_07745 [Bdellovibrio sp. CG10_big_fil_rev_8_21_14_0_10_47_8]|nr:MAG: hypothetical protein COT73_07745 [Bdellovibrio sp. CG10_big_fil_rev_8_21_14_0_10_47_8]